MDSDLARNETRLSEAHPSTPGDQTVVEPMVIRRDDEAPAQAPSVGAPRQASALPHVVRPASNGHPPNAPRAASERPGQAVERSNLKRMMWLTVSLVLVGLVVGSYFGYQYLDNMINYVSTSNAQVASQNVSVGSINAGRVVSLRVDVGAQVHSGEVLAQIELPSAVRTLQNGTSDLEFLGAADQRTEVVSPMNGIVVTVPVTVNQTVSQGQPLVVLMDPSRVWINANVDENQIARVHVGQSVQTYVAAAGKTVSGKVLAITPATAASFLPMPAANATGDYANPGQLIPVKISADDRRSILFVGATAQVKIRVT